MRLFLRLFLLLAFASTAFSAGGQEDVPQFTVQVGSFANAKPADFSALAPVGFVYATERPSSHADVFLGGYASQAEAEKVAESLRLKGYANAFVSRLNAEGGQSVTLVQLAAKKVGEKINWDEFFKLERIYVLLNGSQVKIFTGIYPDVETAKAQLPRLKAAGFKDAFVKNANNALLHEVGEFEAGGAAKKPLIPLDFEDKPIVTERKPAEKRAEPPTSYEEEVAVIGGGKKPVEKSPALSFPKGTATVQEKQAPALTPKEGSKPLRPDVKRTSALELQRVLKAEGIYKGSLDGFYGKGTRTAYEQALNTNRQLQKYLILSRHVAKPDGEAARGTLQYFINTLWDDPSTALDGLEASKSPVAKAYRAYFLFASDGASWDVNALMNQAIAEAFAGSRVPNLPRFDYNATYSYADLDQLLLHLRYIHEVSPDKPAAPCWLFRRHPGAALRAFGRRGSASGGGGFKLQACGGFWEWEEVQVLDAMTKDVSAESQVSEAKLADSQSELARLYLAPKALADDERKSLETWNAALWKGIGGWAVRDPMLAETAVALRIGFFQTQAMLEDFFMDEGFNEKDAKGLALAALKAMVGHQLERFV